MKTLELIPGTGLSSLQFGMSMTEVEQILGGAQKSYTEEDGQYTYKVLDYPEQGISLFFRESYGYRFSSIEVNITKQSIRLFGESLASKSRDQVVELLRNNLPEDEMREIQESPLRSTGQSSVWVPSLGAMFYFDRAGLLQELQWSPLLDPEGQFLWPET